MIVKFQIDDEYEFFIPCVRLTEKVDVERKFSV